MYLFVSVVVKNNDLWVWSVLFVNMVMVMDKLADVHGYVNAICAVVISLRDEESVSIQDCLDKVFVGLMNICGVRFVGDEICNMLFKLCPISLLVVCYC